MINNKTLEGYLELFKKIKSIITIENSKKLELESYSTDFEIALINALGIIFKDVKQIGCYFHYCKNIRKKGIKYKLINKKNTKNNVLINELYILPYKYKGDKSNIKEIYSKYTNENTKEFIDYFRNQWEPYFLNDMLNYNNISKNIRSNSYIENYNRRLKLKLSKFLYGKNKCLVTWPLLLYFIINEENEYPLEIYNSETKLEEKINNNFNIYLEDAKINNQELELKEKKGNMIQFLSWKNNSCRYDIFFYLFTFLILRDIETIDNFENNNIRILKNISLELLTANKNY